MTTSKTSCMREHHAGLLMSLPNNLKDLYAEWLQEFISTLNPKQEQLTLTYEKAKRNLLEADETIYYPKDLKKVKGIGDTIMKRLEKRLKDYCDEIKVEMPQPAASTATRGTKRGTTTLRSNSTDINGAEPPPKKLRKYIPKKRSGGYGILLALLEANAVIPKGISKDDTINLAQKYCDHSLNPNFATREFKGAWASITALKNHEFVFEEGRPKRYSLTEEGINMARILKSTDGVKFPQELENSQNLAHNSEKDAMVDANEFTANYSELLGTETPLDAELSFDRDNSLLDITFQDSQSTPRISKMNRSFTGDDNSSPIRSQHKSKLVPTSGPLIPEIRALKRRFEGTSYELWTKGSYEIFPIIDHREIKSQSNRDFFTKAFMRRGINSEVRQLALGDIIWVAKHKESGTEAVLNTIIERKRLDDLALSIRDNRFMEQKSRLEKTGCKNKYYLIEETMSDVVEGMTEALKTTIWLILVYYRFSIIRTTNSDATVERLHSLHTVLEEEYSRRDLLVINPHNLQNQDDYRYELEKFRQEFERTKNIECCHNFQCFQEILGKGELSTIGELTIHILMFIKGISIEKAVAIQSVFPTLKHILTAYAECRSPEEAKLLMFNKFGNAPGLKKITKNLSEKIADVFNKS